MCKNIFCFSFICLSRLFDTNIAKLILYHLDDEWEKYWRIIDFKYFRRQIGPFTPQFSTIPSKFGSARQPLAQLAELYNVIGGSSNLFWLIPKPQNRNGWIDFATCNCFKLHYPAIASICTTEGDELYGYVKITNYNKIYTSLYDFILDWIELNEDMPVHFCNLFVQYLYDSDNSDDTFD